MRKHGMRDSLIIAIITLTLSVGIVLYLALFDCGRIENKSCFGTNQDEYMKLVDKTSTAYPCCYDNQCYACYAQDVYFFENKEYKCNITITIDITEVDDLFAKYKIGNEYTIYLKNSTCNFDVTVSNNMWLIRFVLGFLAVCGLFGFILAIGIPISKRCIDKDAKIKQRLITHE